MVEWAGNGISQAQDDIGTAGRACAFVQLAHPALGGANGMHIEGEMNKPGKADPICEQSAESIETADALPQQVQEFLGRELRRAYGQVVNEPLPEAFTRLLEKLACADDQGADRS